MTIEKRSEILFLYDVVHANPNGDPLDENKPRIDENTGKNFVTDVRLKRTIRDYLAYNKGLAENIFVKKNSKEDGTLLAKEELIKIEDIKTRKEAEEKLLKKFIDIRLFGATIGLPKKEKSKKDKGDSGEGTEEVKGNSLTWTGPVQFKYGISLHRVAPLFVKGTTVMPSGEGKAQGTFTERYILPYSLIAFYGIINENAVAVQNLGTTDDDVKLMLEGMWNGTKNLITGSKAGQMPRLLIQIIYKEKNYLIGELDRRISLISKKRDEEIQDIADASLDVSKLIEAINDNHDKIEKICWCIDGRIKLCKDGKEVDRLGDEFKNIETVEEKLSW